MADNSDDRSLVVNLLDLDKQSGLLRLLLLLLDNHDNDDSDSRSFHTVGHTLTEAIASCEHDLSGYGCLSIDWQAWMDSAKGFAHHLLQQEGKGLYRDPMRFGALVQTILEDMDRKKKTGDREMAAPFAKAMLDWFNDNNYDNNSDSQFVFPFSWSGEMHRLFGDQSHAPAATNSQLKECLALLDSMKHLTDEAQQAERNNRRQQVKEMIKGTKGITKLVLLNPDLQARCILDAAVIAAEPIAFLDWIVAMRGLVFVPRGHALARTHIQVAADANQPLALRFLLSVMYGEGIVDYANGEEGNTALHYAVQHHSLDMILALDGQGARWDIANHQGLLPADMSMIPAMKTDLQRVADMTPEERSVEALLSIIGGAFAKQMVRGNAIEAAMNDKELWQHRRAEARAKKAEEQLLAEIAAEEGTERSKNSNGKRRSFKIVKNG